MKTWLQVNHFQNNNDRYRTKRMSTEVATQTSHREKMPITVLLQISAILI